LLDRDQARLDQFQAVKEPGDLAPVTVALGLPREAVYRLAASAICSAWMSEAACEGGINPGSAPCEAHQVSDCAHKWTVRYSVNSRQRGQSFTTMTEAQTYTHSLRHQFASEALDANPPELTNISQILGHDRVETLHFYINLKHASANAEQRIGAMMNARWTRYGRKGALSVRVPPGQLGQTLTALDLVGGVRGIGPSGT
jgi:hypothetical protein